MRAGALGRLAHRGLGRHRRDGPDYFGVVVGAGMVRFGPVGFWPGQVPHMDVPLGAGRLS